MRALVEREEEMFAEFVRNLRLKIDIHEQLETLVVDWLKMHR